jgi:RHS repeat-associated protein
MVDRLIDADPGLLGQRDASGNSPINVAAYMGNQSLTQHLRNKRGTPDFHEAIIVGDIATVRAELARGRNVNEFAPDGFPTLGLAVFFRHTEIAHLLLDEAGWHQRWQLQSLTDLGTLPDYEEGKRDDSQSSRGAPVDAKNTNFTESRKYIGEQYDSDTAFSYLNARYYNGGSGKFLSQDPVVLALGTADLDKAMPGYIIDVNGTPVSFSQYALLANPQMQNYYSYAVGNPTTKKDPSGKGIDPVTFVTGFIVGATLQAVTAKP